jgi:N-formylglutamate amidohydrolase
MSELVTYTLSEISRKLQVCDLPFSGITRLGSSEFHILQPAHYAGVVMHSGHRVRPEIRKVLAVGPEDRYREEDPYMDRFITGFPIQILARDSRFEYDTNWEAEEAIYDANRKKWGLQVWQRELTEQERLRTLDKYHEFHALMDMVTEFMLKQNPQVLIFDMHSYCYQREKKQHWISDERPDINLGTRAVNRKRFAPLIDLLLEKLALTKVEGQKLRVAENEIFPGGYLSRKYSRLYPDHVLVLALEYKKLFMDEFTGELYDDLLEALITSFKGSVQELISLSLKF